MCDANTVVMCALYRYQQTFLICEQKSVGAVRYVSMLYGGKMIIDKSFKTLKPDNFGCLAFSCESFLLLDTVQFNYATTTVA